MVAALTWLFVVRSEFVSWGALDPLPGGGFSNLASYLVLIAVLFARPYGMFGRPDVERV